MPRGCRRPSYPCRPALSRTEAVVRAFAMMRMIDYRKALLMPLPDDRNILKFGPPKYPGEVEITPAMVESVRQRFTMFSTQGMPLRATLTVSLREYKTLDKQLQQLQLMSPDHTRTHVVQRGETLNNR